MKKTAYFKELDENLLFLAIKNDKFSAYEKQKIKIFLKNLAEYQLLVEEEMKIYKMINKILNDKFKK